MSLWARGRPIGSGEEGRREGRKEGRKKFCFVWFGTRYYLYRTVLEYVADDTVCFFFLSFFHFSFFFPFLPPSGKLVKNGLGHDRCGRANVCALVD